METIKDCGFSKREFFSIMILQGMAARIYDPVGWGDDPAILAKRAIMVADALIEELNKG